MPELTLLRPGPDGPSTPKQAEPLLVAERLSKHYRMGDLNVQALSALSISLHPGEFVVLLGSSGSGKSTLLNILGGLDQPTSGRVLYRGTDLAQADEATLTDYRRRHIGFVFQFYNLIPSLTAEENLALVTDLIDEPMKPSEALELVGMAARRHHFPAQLSGGEQQRVAIARAVAKRPQLLLCDEPTGALDSRTGVKVLDVIRRVSRELGTCAVVITHSAPIAEMADRVLTMSDGQIHSERKNAQPKSAMEITW
jgi:putative ABC transport system ATP-binding protein